MNKVDKLEKDALAKLAAMSEDLDHQLLCRPPVDLETIGTCWGVRAVVKRELDVPALLYRLENSQTAVFLNEADSPGRQRFSWAHELGHIVMAEKAVPQVSCRNGRLVNKSLERSCDVIAAELLMPRKVFEEAAEKVGWTLGGVSQLARRFEVTMQAAAVRLCELRKEPLMMSVWQSKVSPITGLRYKWARANQAGKVFRPKIEWKTNPDAVLPLYEAYQSSRVVSGRCKVLLTKDKLRNFRDVPSEAIGVGSGSKRTVIGFHYLDVNS